MVVDPPSLFCSQLLHVLFWLCNSVLWQLRLFWNGGRSLISIPWSFSEALSCAYQHWIPCSLPRYFDELSANYGYVYRVRSCNFCSKPTGWERTSVTAVKIRISENLEHVNFQTITIGKSEIPAIRFHIICVCVRESRDVNLSYIMYVYDLFYKQFHYYETKWNLKTFCATLLTCISRYVRCLLVWVLSTSY